MRSTEIAIREIRPTREMLGLAKRQTNDFVIIETGRVVVMLNHDVGWRAFEKPTYNRRHAFFSALTLSREAYASIAD